MNEMQYLIACKNPVSWSIVYKRSILLQNVTGILSIGKEVKFLWPEDSAKAKTFKGQIIAMSGKIF